MSDVFMNDEQYIKERLEDQINWYSGKSSKCQNLYKRFQVVEIILAATTPILGTAALVYDNWNLFFTLAMSAFGAAIAVIESLCKMYKWHENWIQYRYISELLKHEKFLYITKASPYDEENAFEFLVQRVERTISSENVNWVGLNEEKNHVIKPSSTSSPTA